jgi:hypothetical protein
LTGHSTLWQYMEKPQCQLHPISEDEAMRLRSLLLVMIVALPTPTFAYEGLCRAIETVATAFETNDLSTVKGPPSKRDTDAPGWYEARVTLPGFDYCSVSPSGSVECWRKPSFPAGSADAATSHRFQEHVVRQEMAEFEFIIPLCFPEAKKDAILGDQVLEFSLPKVRIVLFRLSGEIAIAVKKP